MANIWPLLVLMQPLAFGTESPPLHQKMDLRPRMSGPVMSILRGTRMKSNALLGLPLESIWQLALVIRLFGFGRCWQEKSLISNVPLSKLFILKMSKKWFGTLMMIFLSAVPTTTPSRCTGKMEMIGHVISHSNPMIPQYGPSHSIPPVISSPLALMTRQSKYGNHLREKIIGSVLLPWADTTRGPSTI